MDYFACRTCNTARYSEYLVARHTVRGALSPFYQRAFFRQVRYTVYLGTKSSEDKLADKIRHSFGADGRAVVVLWGNWGSDPNKLRNGAPTPGIGLRRFIHRRLQNDNRDGATYLGATLTVSERMTSSVCNACGGAVSHAVSANGEPMYRRLVCQNVACGVSRHRDILGCSNIMLNGMHILLHGHSHPWFA